MNRNSLMMKLRILMIALTLGSAFALSACVVEAPESDDMTEFALEGADVSSSELTQSAADEFQTEVECPLRWTCDSDSFFLGPLACQAACGDAPCYRDYQCGGSCVCP